MRMQGAKPMLTEGPQEGRCSTEAGKEKGSFILLLYSYPNRYPCAPAEKVGAQGTPHNLEGTGCCILAWGQLCRSCRSCCSHAFQCNPPVLIYVRDSGCVHGMPTASQHTGICCQAGMGTRTLAPAVLPRKYSCLQSQSMHRVRLAHPNSGNQGHS